MREPFRIFKVQGDGNLHFVEAVQTLNDAKARVRELGEYWSGEYVIRNEETGERVPSTAGRDTKAHLNSSKGGSNDDR